MTDSEPPVEPAPEDDTALLTAALEHSWAWYDGRRQRADSMINYYLVATAILITAYTSAVNGKHWGFATTIALAGLGLTAAALTAALHERRVADVAVPALTELQERIAGRLHISSMCIFTNGEAQIRGTRPALAMGLGLATLLNIGALSYALVRLF
jgi:hypothetical protein